MRGERRLPESRFVGGFEVLSHTSDLVGSSRSGGVISLIGAHALRPGETLQGFSGAVTFLTSDAYSIHSPRPIYYAGLFLVTMATLPEALKQVWLDRDRGDTAALPLKFSDACFREIYNNYFANDDRVIDTALTNTTERNLPPLIRTMEVVNDDEMDESWAEWIYSQTGRYPARIGCERLDDGMARSRMVATEMITAGSVLRAGCHWGAAVGLSSRKNFAVTEPGFICLVAGFYEEPNDVTSYGGPGGDNDVGEMFDIDALRNRNAWISRNQEDPGTITGDIGSVNTLNFWKHGSMTFKTDWDPQTFTVVADAESLANESTEGSEDYNSQIKGRVNMSVLSDMDVFR